MDTQKTVDNLKSCLRGEIAATETYQQAIEKVGTNPGAAELRTIHDDHREIANEFRKHVHQFGGQPDQGSGAWGTFAKAVEGTAKVFGAATAIKALKEGEEFGIGSYESMLKDEDMPAECRSLITESLNRCRNHVVVLDRLMESSKA